MARPEGGWSDLRMRLEAGSGRRKLASVVTSLALASVLSSCGSATSVTSDGGLATVRFHYSVGASTLPIEIADRKGFFEKHGINFVGTKVTPGPGLIPSLGRQSDILQTSVQAVLE